MEVTCFYHWASLFGLFFLSALCSGKLLHCACNTQHCRSTGMRSCTTQYKCYQQFLERSDGSNPLTNGCISGNTPLLCENRFPAITHMKWPYLICCDTGDMCNSGGLSTLPPWGGASHEGNFSSSPPADHRHVMTALGHSVINQPVVMVVLVIGSILLAGIMGFGFYILKKQSMYLTQLSQRNGYSKSDTLTAKMDTPDDSNKV